MDTKMEKEMSNIKKFEKQWSEFDATFQNGNTSWAKNNFEKWQTETSALFESKGLVKRFNSISRILELDYEYLEIDAYNKNNPDKKIPLREIENEEFPERFDIVKVNKIWVIIQDELYRLKSTSSDIEDLEIQKLLKARQENPDFEKELADMITGGNQGDRYFPDINEYEITDLDDFLADFSKCHSRHRNQTIQTRLECTVIWHIHKLIRALFRKGRFREKSIDIAKKYFKKWVEDSIETNEELRLSEVLGLNIRNELLFNKKTKSEDITLNKKVDKSKDFFAQGDKQSALENLWDAFERMKTLLNDDKKKSVIKIIELLSANIDSSVWENEFATLTKIGNDYQVRHFETDKKPIKSEAERDYLYFRLLSLIDFTLDHIQLVDKDSLIL